MCRDWKEFLCVCILFCLCEVHYVFFFLFGFCSLSSASVFSVYEYLFHFLVVGIFVFLCVCTLFSVCCLLFLCFHVNAWLCFSFLSCFSMFVSVHFPSVSSLSTSPSVSLLHYRNVSSLRVPLYFSPVWDFLLSCLILPYSESQYHRHTLLSPSSSFTFLYRRPRPPLSSLPTHTLTPTPLHIVITSRFLSFPSSAFISSSFSFSHTSTTTLGSTGINITLDLLLLHIAIPASPP